MLASGWVQYSSLWCHIHVPLICDIIKMRPLFSLDLLMVWSCDVIKMCPWSYVMSSRCAGLSSVWCLWDIPKSLHMMSWRSALFHSCVFPEMCAWSYVLHLPCDVIEICPLSYVMSSIHSLLRSRVLFEICSLCHVWCHQAVMCPSSYLWWHCHQSLFDLICDVPINILCDITEMCLWSYMWCHQDVAIELQSGVISVVSCLRSHPCDVIKMCPWS